MSHLASKRYAENQRYVHLHTYMHGNRVITNISLPGVDSVILLCILDLHSLLDQSINKNKETFTYQLFTSPSCFIQYLWYKTKNFVFKDNSSLFHCYCHFSFIFCLQICSLWTWSFGFSNLVNIQVIFHWPYVLEF